MEEVLQRFTAWFIKFAVVSAIILLTTHLIARSIRSKKKQKSPSETTPDQSTENKSKDSGEDLSTQEPRQ